MSDELTAALVDLNKLSAYSKEHFKTEFAPWKPQVFTHWKQAGDVLPAQVWE